MHDADRCTDLAPRLRMLDPAVVERHAEPAPLLGVELGPVATAGQGARQRRFGDLGRELLERAGAPQVEVSTGTGVVYALRQGGWTLVAVTSRFALSSLVFFDMRKTLEELSA